MFFCHFTCCFKKCKHILFALWHYCNFRDICTEFLHFHKASYDIVFVRCLIEIMVGCNNFYAVCMRTFNDIFYHFITCKCFYIYKVNQSCCCCFLVKLCICICFDCFFAAFFGSTECEKDRSFAECRTKVF